MKAEVTSNTKEKLGDVENLMINPANGRIDFVILGRGGFLDFGEKYIAVPWDKVTATSHKEISLNVSKQQLEAAPRVSKDLADLKDPQFISKVYRYFGESPAVGAAETPGGKSTSGSTAQNSKSSP